MGRAAKHNWKNLYLEYCQGRYKNMKQFAEAKGLNYDRVKKEFKKLKDQAQDLTAEKESSEKNASKKGQKGAKKGGKILPPEKKGQKEHPWQRLKKQFLDWPEDKLQAYLVHIEERLAELKEIPFEEMTEEEIKELGRLRRERRAILSDPDPDRKCSARNRDGSPCQNPAERGKNVCWNHGGAPGSGCPPRRQNALKHGFYARIFPDDEETRAIIEEINAKSPLDMLWDDIVIQQAAIARAQKLMFVRDKQDITKHLKRERYTENTEEREWEFQYPWDKHASFLKAQSEAMKAMERLLARYDALLQSGMDSEEHRLRLEKLKQSIGIEQEKLQLAKDKLALVKTKLESDTGPGKGDAWADLVAEVDDDACEDEP